MFTGRSAYNHENWKRRVEDAVLNEELFATRSFAWPRVAEAGEMFRVRGKEAVADAVELTLVAPYSATDPGRVYMNLKRLQHEHRGYQRDHLNVRVSDETIPTKSLLLAAIHLQTDHHGGNDPNDVPCLCVYLDGQRYEQLKLLLTILDSKGKKSRDTFTCGDILQHLEWIASQYLPLRGAKRPLEYEEANEQPPREQRPSETRERRASQAKSSVVRPAIGIPTSFAELDAAWSQSSASGPLPFGASAKRSRPSSVWPIPAQGSMGLSQTTVPTGRISPDSAYKEC